MKTLKLAPLKSISHGTLRPQDLLSAFISELEWQISNNGEYFSDPANFSERDRLNNLVGEAQDCFAEDGEEIDPEKEEDADYLINEQLPDALQTFAKPYCYFGTHYGDGSDFGFWPSHDQIEELPKISDNSPETVAAELFNHSGSDVAYVNDHGNITVYGGDGSVLLEIV